MALKRLVRSIQGVQDISLLTLDPVEIGFLFAKVELKRLGFLPQALHCFLGCSVERRLPAAR